MENEIGEYGRTNLGNIIKFAWFQNSETGETYKNKVILVDKMMTETYPFYYFKKDEYIVKHSPNIINIIEDEDFCKIEFYSPRYEKRGIRIFEVSKIDEYITFENMHCDLFMINGEWSNNDKRLNPVIKEIYTKEMMESISYKV